MKLNAREAARYCANPDTAHVGLLIYGEDRAEVDARRAAAVAALTKDEDDPSLSVTRIDPSEARRAPGAVADALAATGFFATRQIVVIEGAGDGVTEAAEAALSAATPGAGFLVVTAGILPARSRLRKLFEGAEAAAAAPVYGGGMERGEAAALFERDSGKRLSEEGAHMLETVVAGIDRGAAQDLVTRLSLYALDAEGPIDAASVKACAPAMGEAGLDELTDALAEGRAGAIAPLLNRLRAQGVEPVRIGIAATQKFRRLHRVASQAAAGGKLEAAIARLSPPVFGPRRDALLRQAGYWAGTKTEGALSLLLETDRGMRGGVDVDGYALLERAFLKLALSARR